MVDAIKTAKKIDSFYKNYASEIAPAFSVIMYMVDKYHVVPSECKITKLAFLKTRTIFSCSFETRILETLIKRGLDEAIEGVETSQMAYQKNRSTQLCVAVGLNEAEKLDDLGFQWSADQKKAFDSAYWTTIAQTFQRKAGAGNLLFNYFQKRNYRFRGKLGFQRFPMGRGAPPGTIMSPLLFAFGFQGTDKSVAVGNPTYKWEGNFSDDKQPLAEWSKVMDGSLQKALDDTWKWSQDNFVDYHLTGSKAPEYYILRKKGDKSRPDIGPNGLKLGVTELTRAYETCQLGISIQYFKDDEIPNDFGYKLVWKSKKCPFSRLAYRFQDIKDWWDPEMRWKCVDAYMIGKLNYGSALHWLRADPAQIDQVRFTYAMAMASVASLETPECVSLRCCKKQSVSEKNVGFLKLCKFLNMPTLKDMAIRDARVLLGQWKIFRPDDFWLNDKSEVIGVRNHKPGSLLRELFYLSKQSLNDWYPEYREYCAKKKARKFAYICKEYKPLWKQFWEECTRKCDEAGNEDRSFRNRLFKTVCQEYFEVAEPYARVRKQLDAPILRRTKRPREDSSILDVDQPSSKRGKANETIDLLTGEKVPANVDIADSLDVNSQRKSAKSKAKKRKRVADQDIQEDREVVVRMDCQISHPPVRGVKNRPCRICGYVIKKRTVKQVKQKIETSVELLCCKKEAHITCWENARKNSLSSPCCSEIQNWLNRDQKTVRKVTRTSAIAEGCLVAMRQCDFCGDLIEICEDNRHHIFDHCGKSARSVQVGIDPARKRRKGAGVLVDRFYTLLSQKDSTRSSRYSETALGERSSRKESALTSDERQAYIAEVGVT